MGGAGLREGLIAQKAQKPGHMGLRPLAIPFKEASVRF